jgi:hypothetical protein
VNTESDPIQAGLDEMEAQGAVIIDSVEIRLDDLRQNSGASIPKDVEENYPIDLVRRDTLAKLKTSSHWNHSEYAAGSLDYFKNHRGRPKLRDGNP